MIGSEINGVMTAMRGVFKWEEHILMTKIDIITGFLGAGKTTLIRKLIKENPYSEKIVLIENEFGDVNIDAQFLFDTKIEITELTAGCICCTLLGDFGIALKEIMADIKPDRIIVEPSGVAKATDVIKAVEIAAIPDLYINSISNVVDATLCDAYLEEFGDFYKDQIWQAGCVLMSRTDECRKTELNTAVEAIRKVNPNAGIVTTPWDELSGNQMYLGICLGKDSAGKLIENLLEVKTHNCQCGDHHENPGECAHSHSHRSALDVFSSVSFETIHTFTENELSSRLKSLHDCQGQVLRAKGIVKDHEEGWLHFDYVPNKLAIRKGTPATTGMICVIGTDISKEEIGSSLFNHSYQ